MRTALIPVGAHRPQVVWHEGGYVVVSVHDAAHRAERAAWKRRRRAAHPDRGGSARDFLLVTRAYRRWLRRERCWYATFGLVPPDNTVHPLRERGGAQSLSGRWTRYQYDPARPRSA